MNNTLFQSENRLKTDTTNNVPFIPPDVNIFETKDGYVLEAEMPGVGKAGLEVTLEGNELTIIGHRMPEQSTADPVVAECRNVNYRRVFELDPAIDRSKIDARMHQGILTLTLPKTEKVKPRRIQIAD